MDDLRGFGRRAPLPAFCLMVFVLSLAGIPPAGRLFREVLLFATAMERAPHSLGCSGWWLWRLP
jgi:NADH-quinone oxidoreductase subunit N